ncbi:hypothetical protein RUM43_011352 [Polyplax serrata]|uniref:Transmembrane protein 69 n=1 Tax=Polyplax serrata TaxID=468196 RepID=A0AAN8RTI7_POLSC
MVYGLFCFTVRRNFKLYSKTYQQAEIILQRQLPWQVLSGTSFSTCKVDKNKKPNLGGLQSQLNSFLNQIKGAANSVGDVKTLPKRILSSVQLKSYKDAPQTVQMVTLAGLAPMFGIPFLSLLTGHAYYCCAFAHLACGATILSFLGGTNLNDAIAQNDVSYERLGWCVMPQLVGWTSLLLPLPLGIMLASFGYCLTLVHDVLLSKYPPWMKSLRFITSGGIIVSFFLMLIFYILL